MGLKHHSCSENRHICGPAVQYPAIYGSLYKLKMQFDGWRAIAVVLFALILCLDADRCLASGEIPSPTTMPAEVSFLFAQNNRSRSAITSATYEISDELDDIVEGTRRRHVTSTYKIAERDRLRATERESHTTYLDGHTPAMDLVTMAEKGPISLAVEWNHSGCIEKFDYASIDNMSHDAISAEAGFLGVGITNYGFGDGRATFKNSPFLTNPERVRWKTRELQGDAGQPLYVVDFYAFANQVAMKGNPDFSWTFDSAVGYLITHVQKYGPDRKVIRDIRVDCVQDGLGRSYPQHIVELDYVGRYGPDTVRALGLSNEDEPSSRWVATISNVKCNIPIPDSTFTIGYFHARFGSVGTEIETSGERKVRAVAGDQFVSPAFIPGMRRAANPLLDQAALGAPTVSNSANASSISKQGSSGAARGRIMAFVDNFGTYEKLYALLAIVICGIVLTAVVWLLRIRRTQ
jgi:hypothetical protein